MRQRHQKFSKRGIFYGTKNKRSEAGVCVWHVTKILKEEKNMKQKLKSFTKNIKIEKRGEHNSTTQTCHRREAMGVWGKAPSRWVI